MELTIALALSILSAVISVSSFALSRKDKAVKDSEDKNYGLLNYKIDSVDKKVDKIIDKMEKYEYEFDDKLEKAMNTHVEMYHKGG
jgi:hypothetical protein